MDKYGKMQPRKEVNKKEKKTRAEIYHVLYSHLIFISIAAYYIIGAYSLLYRPEKMAEKICPRTFGKERVESVKKAGWRRWLHVTTFPRLVVLFIVRPDECHLKFRYKLI